MCDVVVPLCGPKPLQRERGGRLLDNATKAKDGDDNDDDDDDADSYERRKGRNVTGRL